MEIGVETRERIHPQIVPRADDTAPRRCDRVTHKPNTQEKEQRMPTNAIILTAAILFGVLVSDLGRRAITTHRLIRPLMIAAGAGAVYLSEPNPRRRQRAEALGLAGVLDPTATDLVAELHTQFPDGVDVAIECAGNQPALDACIDAVRPGATIVQTALHLRPVQIDPTRLTLRDVSLKGVNCFPVTSWPRVIRLIASGRLPAERIVTGQVKLASAIEDGFHALLDPNSDHIKILVAAE